MGVVTLRPEGPIHSTGGWVAVNGHTGAVTTSRTDMVTFTSDRDDATYVESPIGNVGVVDLHFGTFAFPALAQIRSVAPVLRAALIKESDNYVRLNVRLFEGIGDDYHPYGQQVLVSGARGVYTYSLGAVTTNVKGEPWTQVNIDRTRLGVRRTNADDRDRPQIRDMWLLVDYNEAPVITLTGPVDEDAATAGIQVTSTSSPTIDGTYSDPEGDAMERAHWGVWPESVYSTWPAGFVPTLHIDPKQRTPGWVWYEGPVLTPSLLRKVTTPLPNGNYRAYAMAADAGSDARYSATVSRTWTQAVPAPPTPTLTATVDVANARITLTAVASATTPNTEFVMFEKIVDGRRTPLLGFERVTATPGATITAYDYLSDPAVTTEYRVRAGRVVAGSDVVSAAVTASARQTLDSWWWKVPENPPDNLRVMPVDEGQQMGLVRAKVEQAAEFAVLGALPVTLSARSRDHRFPVTLYFPTEAAMKDYERRYEQYRDGMLQAPDRQWYGRLGPATTIREHGPARFVDVEFSERKRP